MPGRPSRTEALKKVEIFDIDADQAEIEANVAMQYEGELPDGERYWEWWAWKFEFIESIDEFLSFDTLQQTKDKLIELKIQYAHNGAVEKLYTTVKNREHTPGQLGSAVKATRPRAWAATRAEEEDQRPMGAGSAGDD